MPEIACFVCFRPANWHWSIFLLKKKKSCMVIFKSGTVCLWTKMRFWSVGAF